MASKAMNEELLKVSYEVTPTEKFKLDGTYIRILTIRARRAEELEKERRREKKVATERKT